MAAKLVIQILVNMLGEAFWAPTPTRKIQNKLLAPGSWFQTHPALGHCYGTLVLATHLQQWHSLLECQFSLLALVVILFPAKETWKGGRR